MKRTRAAMLAVTVTVTTAGCGESRTEISIAKWHTGPGWLRGHEDILRHAINRANTMIGHDVFPRIVLSEEGRTTTNPLLQGNFQTDFPQTTSLVAKRYGWSGGTWHSAPSYQYLHFLRNRSLPPIAVLDTHGVACRRSRAAITSATADALRLRSGAESTRHESFVLIGHASHIIQDGFSPEHVKRDPANLEKMLQICSYNAFQISGVCHHRLFELNDRVWRNAEASCASASERAAECLTTEAQAAVAATTQYLEVVATNGDLRAFLERYFACNE